MCGQGILNLLGKSNVCPGFGDHPSVHMILSWSIIEKLGEAEDIRLFFIVGDAWLLMQ